MYKHEITVLKPDQTVNSLINSLPKVDFLVALSSDPVNPVQVFVPAGGKIVEVDSREYKAEQKLLDCTKEGQPIPVTVDPKEIKRITQRVAMSTTTMAWSTFDNSGCFCLDGICIYRG